MTCWTCFSCVTDFTLSQFQDYKQIFFILWLIFFFYCNILDETLEQWFSIPVMGNSWSAHFVGLSYLTTRAGPSLYEASGRILFGAPQCHQYDWLLSKLDYSHTINLTHPFSLLFVVAVLLTIVCLACFYLYLIFNCNSWKLTRVVRCWFAL